MADSSEELYDVDPLSLSLTASPTQQNRSHDMGFAGDRLIQITSLTQSELEKRDGGRNEKLDIRTLIRCIQCPLCWLPMRTPIRLPCNNWICGKCLLPPNERFNDIPRKVGGRNFREHILVSCPFSEQKCSLDGERECGMAHGLDDCAVDITLQTVVENFNGTLNEFEVLEDEGHRVSISIWLAHGGDDDHFYEVENISTEGRVIGTYRLAERGVLPYRAHIEFNDLSEGSEYSASLENRVLSQLRKTIVPELRCPVCLLLPPLGLERSSTKLQGLIEQLLPNKLDALRKEKIVSFLGGQNKVPVIDGIVCPIQDLVIPVTHLEDTHAIKFAIDNRFQYVGVFKSVYNDHKPPYNKYGTLLRINDRLGWHNRSLVVTGHGLAIIKITDIDMTRGFPVATVEEIPDIPPAARGEIAQPIKGVFSQLITATPGQNDLNMFSTSHLLELAWDYFNPNAHGGFPWPGDMWEYIVPPPGNVAEFPYWITRVVSLPREEKYRLLRTNNVRHRMEIVVSWLINIETRRW
ncbi:hypothetical protein EMCG_00273 [[Emmonsia] crescens]|uniref:Lon N-terminal domain-containing protein n=1 Tax=[Emmonsia] crescens TaxID=73230 RepID=A0A0G2HZL1_9EURO|nr:hypothetical protein EMCG_00273 [Emmonsia crescens UAMH 3008]